MSLDVNMSEPEEFNCLELHSCIKEVAITKGFKDFGYHIECLSGKGNNYIANVFRVVIKNTEDENDVVCVIVKTLINTERQVLFYELHKREVMAYNRILNKFCNVQNNIDEKQRLILPNCLYSSAEINNEVIILNDLKSKGFEIDESQAKFEFLSFDAVNSVIRELAKFHALSFVLEKQVPEEFNEMKTDFQDILFQDNFLNKSKLRNYFLESFEMSLKIVTDRDAKEKLKKVKESLLDLFQMYTRPGKMNVLCHGDCWVNNILFKHEDSGQSRVCFIDYQAMRYANPMTDIAYFLYVCTESKFRSKHFHELKDTYYNSLSSFLSLYNIDVNKAYGRNDFNLDLEDHRLYGLIIAMVELRVVTMTPHEDAVLKGSKLTSNMNLSQVPGESDLFSYRVNDLVDEAVANGILDKLINKMNT